MFLGDPSVIMMANNNANDIIAVDGDATNALSSHDGIIWTTATTPFILGQGSAGNEYRHTVASNGASIVALRPGTTSTAARSADYGLTWSSVTLPSSQLWTAVLWCGTQYVAISVGTAGATSPDGITWTARTLPAGVPYCDIAYSGSIIVVVTAGFSNAAASSPDGITWTARTLPAVANWTAVAWNGTDFVAVSSGTNQTASSSDGITWGSAAPITGSAWDDICWNGSVLCVVGRDTTNVYTSSDSGNTWVNRGVVFATGSYALTWNGRLFCAAEAGEASTSAFTSPDGITWTARTLSTSIVCGGICSPYQVFGTY